MFPLALLNPSAPAVDPASLTLALLHFDGTDGSTTFTDSSANNVAITTVSTAQLSTTIKQFGSASLYLPANTAYATVPVTTANFAGQDFCIELWVYPVTKGGYGNIIGHSGASSTLDGFALQWDYSTNKIRFLSGSLGGSAWTLDQTSVLTVALNTWTHIAVTREGQILRVFINGVIAISIDSASTLWYEQGAGTFRIGAGYGNNRFGVGYIDEVRIRKEAVYTADFTPPTAPFTY
jgi:hypothetical protein